MLLAKHKRKTQRVSQHVVAIATGISQPTISLIENGRLQPLPEHLARLAGFYRVSPDDLLKDVVVLDVVR